MNPYPNFIEQSISENIQFCSDFQKSTQEFYNSIDETFLVKGDSTYKIYRTPDDTSIYIFEYNQKVSSLTVYKNKIEDFQKKTPTEELTQYTSDAIKKHSKVYDQLIISFRINSDKKLTNDEFLKKFEPSFNDQEKELFKLIKRTAKGLLKTNPFFLFDNTNKIVCTSQVSEIFSLIQLTNKSGELAKYNTNFLYSLTTKLNSFVEENIDTIFRDFEYLLKICKEEKFNSVKNAFTYNDLDNQVWTKGKNLIVSSQNLGFYIDIQNDQNFTVYFLEKEYKSINKEIQRIKDAIADNSVDVFKDITLQVENNKVIFANDSLLSNLEFNLHNSKKALAFKGYKAQVNPVDIYSYDYQKDFCYTEYGMSEFEFLAQAFLTLGGGFDYDSKKGEFRYSDVKYINNLLKYDELSDIIVKKSPYCMPKKITHLNEDWTKGLQLMVDILKRDKPKFTVFDKATSKESLDDAISYFEGVLSKLNKKPKIK